MNKKPLLTISIPTYNRSTYLAQTLKQLNSELISCNAESVEILISDNASPDDTELVVKTFISNGLAIRYIRNDKNIGSDANIAQCFNLASGNFVLILGDDDLFVDNALSNLLANLSKDNYGVVCLRSYGFDNDFRKEYPGGFGSNKSYDNPATFLAAIGPLMTLISGCVINKSLLFGIDANDYCGEHLVQVHLVIKSAIAAENNLFIERYMIACKRNNSSGYNFSQVFVENLGQVLDCYIGQGLKHEDVIKIEGRFIISFFPFYLFKQIFYKQGDWKKTYLTFSSRYRGRLFFYLWLFPIFKLPRFLGVAWAAAATFIGRVLNGDLVRGVKFVLNKI